jgi:hypothetical protein
MSRFGLCMLMVLASLTATGCDRGVEMRPVGLKNWGEFEWATEQNGIRFITSGIVGLVGSTESSVSLEIENPTENRVVVQDAVLEANGKSYSVVFSGQREEKWRSAEPRTTDRIELYFRFGQPLYKALGETGSLRVSYRIGPKQDEIRINLARES